MGLDEGPKAPGSSAPGAKGPRGPFQRSAGQALQTAEILLDYTGPGPALVQPMPTLIPYMAGIIIIDGPLGTC